jgi:hypothetical protein
MATSLYDCGSSVEQQLYEELDAGAELRAICCRAHLVCSLNSVDRSFGEPVVGAIHSVTVEICHRTLVRRSWTQAQSAALNAGSTRRESSRDMQAQSRPAQMFQPKSVWCSPANAAPAQRELRC